MSTPSKLASAIALAFALAPGAATAAGQLDYNLYGGIAHSDNINLTAHDPISQTMLIPGVNFTYNQQGEDLQANVIGDVEYRDYLGNRFNDQTQVELASQLNWSVLPDRLDFALQDYAGIQPLDTLASDAPGNQQQTNVFAVGPIYHFRLGSTVRGQAELRYIDSYAEKTKKFNSHRNQGALRFAKILGPTSQLSLNATVQQVDFYNDTESNYDRNELYFRYVSQLTFFDIDAALGESQINYDRAGERTQSSPLARATVSWRPTESSTFSVNVTRQYSDAAQDMMLMPGQTPLANTTGISTGDAVVSSEVYLERRFQLTYALRTERLTLSISPSYRKLGYGNDPTYDQTGRGGNVAIDYRLRPTMTLSAFASGEQLKYHSLSRRDKTLTYGLELADQWTQHWSWRAALTQQRRTSNVPDQGFRETMAYVGIVFKR